MKLKFINNSVTDPVESNDPILKDALDLEPKLICFGRNKSIDTNLFLQPHRVRRLKIKKKKV